MTRKEHFIVAMTRMEDLFIVLEHHWGVADHAALVDAYWSYVKLAR